MASKFWSWYIYGTSFVGTGIVLWFAMKVFEFLKTGQTQF